MKKYRVKMLLPYMWAEVDAENKDDALSKARVLDTWDTEDTGNEIYEVEEIVERRWNIMKDVLVYLAEGSDICIQGASLGAVTKRSIMVNGSKILFGADIIDIQIFENEEVPN